MAETPPSEGKEGKDAGTEAQNLKKEERGSETQAPTPATLGEGKNVVESEKKEQMPPPETPRTTATEKAPPPEEEESYYSSDDEEPASKKAPSKPPDRERSPSSSGSEQLQKHPPYKNVEEKVQYLLQRLDCPDLADKEYAWISAELDKEMK